MAFSKQAVSFKQKGGEKQISRLTYPKKAGG